MKTINSGKAQCTLRLLKSGVMEATFGGVVGAIDYTRLRTIVCAEGEASPVWVCRLDKCVIAMSTVPKRTPRAYPVTSACAFVSQPWDLQMWLDFVREIQGEGALRIGFLASEADQAYAWAERHARLARSPA